jgi:DNA polymerase III delta prime subunit
MIDASANVLLILGEPGAGKTTLLLELTRDLLDRAAQDPSHPIPVVFPLSTWAEQQRPLTDWLVEKLHQWYGVSRELGQTWVAADQIFPLLDDLDQVPSASRAACVQAINAFRQDHGLLPIVVCCWKADYETLGEQLRFQDTIIVQPLSREQVNTYLTQIGQPLAAVRQALHEDPTLWELLDTPLMLTIMTLAYAGQPAAPLQAKGTVEDRRRHLFATYVTRMFQRRGTNTRYSRRKPAPPQREQAEHGLAWLA